MPDEQKTQLRLEIAHVLFMDIVGYSKLLIDEQSEAMIISQFGKIIRMDTTQIREAGRSTQGVRLLHMEGGDKVAAAVVIPKEEPTETTGTLIQ